MTNPLITADPDIDMEARIYKKMLLRVIPIIMLGMFISYIDRANIGVLAGPMSKDLG
ncbi:MAG: MFS transporter, partial [Rhodococcus sp. (in: high G+C Gram-positive bacteria)]